MQTNTREGTYAKLSEFHSKSKEDVIEWAEKVRRVAITNNWRDNWVYMIIAAYLKRATANYYEKVRGNVNQWDRKNAANNLKDLLIIQFT